MTAGSAFRHEFETTYAEPTLLYRALLDAVCDSMDLIERLQDDVDVRGLTVEGSRAQPVCNPSVAELRAQRAALSRLLAQLEIVEPTASRSEAGRALSRARWGAA